MFMLLVECFMNNYLDFTGRIITEGDFLLEIMTKKSTKLESILFVVSLDNFLLVSKFNCKKTIKIKKSKNYIIISKDFAKKFIEISDWFSFTPQQRLNLI